MKALKINLFIAVMLLSIVQVGCKVPAIVNSAAPPPPPDTFVGSMDTSNSATIHWKKYFQDEHLVALIDTALTNNLELLSTLQDIAIARNNVYWKNGLLRPTVTAGGAIGLEKVGRYTSQGAGDASTEMSPGKEVPDPLSDIFLGFRTTWEADVWGKLHNAKKAAFTKYLATMEGRNFVQTNLIAEVASLYYELLALDKQLEIVNQTIDLQKSALEIVKVQKEASVVTELAVKQFEAQFYNSQTMSYEISRQIGITENKLNFLLGRYPQKIARGNSEFGSALPLLIQEGIPSQMLQNRPDIRQASLELAAAKLEVQIAQKEFYPSLTISGLLGIQAYKPSLIFTAPESIAYSLAGDMVGPIINRSALNASFNNANAFQKKALYEYQQSVLNGFQEVVTEMTNLRNLDQAYHLKAKEVEVLHQSIDISSDLFKAARANYLEVLTTQKEALAAKLELVEMKQRQFNAVIGLYKALGGGWN